MKITEVALVLFQLTDEIIYRQKLRPKIIFLEITFEHVTYS